MTDPDADRASEPASDAHQPAVAPTLVQAGLRGLCPRCGAPTLYAGVARFAPLCPNCGLDFSAFNVGDGPAAFLTLGVGTLVTILALVLDVAIRPPVIVHLILWPIVTLAMVVGGLRVAKAALLAAEYRNAAHEGRLRDEA